MLRARFIEISRERQPGVFHAFCESPRISRLDHKCVADPLGIVLDVLGDPSLRTRVLRDRRESK